MAKKSRWSEKLVFNINNGNRSASNKNDGSKPASEKNNSNNEMEFDSGDSKKP